MQYKVHNATSEVIFHLIKLQGLTSSLQEVQGTEENCTTVLNNTAGDSIRQSQNVDHSTRQLSWTSKNQCHEGKKKGRGTDLAFKRRQMECKNGTAALENNLAVFYETKYAIYHAAQRIKNMLTQKLVQECS